MAWGDDWFTAGLDKAYGDWTNWWSGSTDITSIPAEDFTKIGGQEDRDITFPWTDPTTGVQSDIGFGDVLGNMYSWLQSSLGDNGLSSMTDWLNKAGASASGGVDTSGLTGIDPSSYFNTAGIDLSKILGPTPTNLDALRNSPTGIDTSSLFNIPGIDPAILSGLGGLGRSLDFSPTADSGGIQEAIARAMGVANKYSPTAGMESFLEYAPQLQELAMGPTSQLEKMLAPILQRLQTQSISNVQGQFSGLGGLYGSGAAGAAAKASGQVAENAFNTMAGQGAATLNNLYGLALPGFNAAQQYQTGAGLTAAGQGLEGEREIYQGQTAADRNRLEQLLGERGFETSGVLGQLQNAQFQQDLLQKAALGDVEAQGLAKQLGLSKEQSLVGAEQFDKEALNSYFQNLISQDTQRIQQQDIQGANQRARLTADVDIGKTLADLDMQRNTLGASTALGGAGLFSNKYGTDQNSMNNLYNMIVSILTENPYSYAAPIITQNPPGYDKLLGTAGDVAPIIPLL